jgi:hypothetical protein
MSRLSDDEIDELVTQLAKTKWKELGSRLKAANRADLRAGTNRRGDGYPSGGGGPGSKNQISRPTEQAMLATYRLPNGEEGRGFFAAGKDPVRDNVEHAAAYLQQAAQSAKACSNRLDLIDDFVDDAKEPERCECCDRADRRSPMASYTAVSKDGADILDRPYRLCLVCIKLVVEKGRIPTVEEIQRRQDKGTIIERVLKGNR